jgi:hypothetical protein
MKNLPYILFSVWCVGIIAFILLSRGYDFYIPVYFPLIGIAMLLAGYGVLWIATKGERR